MSPKDNPVAVRPAVADDLPAIVAILATDTKGGHDDSTDAMVAPVYLAAFARIQAAGGNHLLVATVNGAVAGVCQLLIQPTLFHRGRIRALLESVYVAPGTQGQGVGRAMVAEAERLALAHGASVMELTSNIARTDAHAFWRRMGYGQNHFGFKKPL